MRTPCNPLPWLTWAYEGESFRVELDQPEMLLGRASSCNVPLPDTCVSRHHATIERVADGWAIADKGSRNGTFVNQERVDRRNLHDGDEITFSRVPLLRLTFHDGSELVTLVDRPSKAETFSVASSFTLRDVVDSPPGVGLSGSHLRGLATRPELSAHPTPHGVVSPSDDKSHAGSWLIRLFSQLGEALLATTDLDELLARILDLTFENLPAERGSVCLHDDATKTIIPKATRRGPIKEPITISKSIVREVLDAQKAVLVRNTGQDGRFENASSVLEMKIRSAMCAPLYYDGKVLGFIYVDSQSGSRPFAEEHLEVLTTFAVFAAVGVEQWRLREAVDSEKRIRSRLERYSSPAVVDHIVENHGGTRMLAEERTVTVLFADLAGFTAMSERMEPGEVADLLNGLFESLAEVLFAHGGTLGKFTGDGVMAVFGAPLEQSDHALRAITSALEMKKAVRDLNETRAHGPRLGMRIGLNSGRVVAGDIGSPKRKDYSVLGDAVNVASRLESAVAQPGQVVVGPETYRLAKAHFEFEELPEIRLKGRERKLRPHLVLGHKGAPPTELATLSSVGW